MMIDLTRLINNIDTSIDINDTVTFDNQELDNAGIKKMDKVQVTGNITKDISDTFNVKLNIKGEMTLPCSITLEDVIFPFDINYENDPSEDEENLKIVGNYLDLIPIIWENIVTEIPLKVTSPNAKLDTLKGDGWEVITDDSKKENQFEVLKDLLKEKEDE